MINECIEISLMILAVHVLLSEGYLFYRVRAVVEVLTDLALGLKAASFIHKPLFECYVCMSSVYTIAFGFEMTWRMPLKILMVCGINYIIERTILIHVDD